MSEPTWAKQRTALRYWLQGHDFTQAAYAMTWAESYHQGTRKDGVTPEFSHQVAIASHLRTFAGILRYPEETITVGLLHDVREDYNVSDEEVRALFGDLVADAVDDLTKEFRGVKRDEEDVFLAIGDSPISSVVKGTDRIHNQSSMPGVFGREKMADYGDETRRMIMPMLKRARKVFTDQEPVYEALGLVLKTQLTYIDALVEAQATQAV